MSKKYNNKSNKYADWTTAYLKRYAKELHSHLNSEYGSYSYKDTLMLEGMLYELDKRGIRPSTELSF